jgi:myo-inositol-1(or 4)-monophosphatase
MLNIAVRAARKAGSVINRATLDGAGFEVRTKQQNDFVTRVDHAAEEAILEIVRKAYPDHAVLAEESGATAGTAEYEWVIDPLDGTTNFIHGFPQYCVSIAIRHRGALAHGVVYDPEPQRAVHRVEGARRLPQRPAHSRFQMHAPRRGAGRHRLSLQGRRAHRPLFEATQEHHAVHCRRAARGAGRARPRLRGVRAARRVLGAGAFAWDMAAGALLIQEAGGLVGDLRGDDGYLQSGEVACATPKIFAALLEALRPQGA